MARPDPSLLDPVRYPFTCEMQTRFGDLDTNLHLNNVALAGMLEDARVRFNRTSGFLAALGDRTVMIVSIGIEYLGQGHYPRPLEVHVAATDIGRTSFGVCQLVMQDGNVVLHARTTMVCVRDNRSAEIPVAFRESVIPFMLRP